MQIRCQNDKVKSRRTFEIFQTWRPGPTRKVFRHIAQRMHIRFINVIRGIVDWGCTKREKGDLKAAPVVTTPASVPSGPLRLCCALDMLRQLWRNVSWVCQGSEHCHGLVVAQLAAPPCRRGAAVHGGGCLEATPSAVRASRPFAATSATTTATPSPSSGRSPTTSSSTKSTDCLDHLFESEH